jgi:hypothetical protein
MKKEKKEKLLSDLREEKEKAIKLSEKAEQIKNKPRPTK